MSVNFDFLDGPAPLTAQTPIGIVHSQTERMLSKRLEEGFLAAVIASKARGWGKLAVDWVQNGFNAEALEREVGSTFRSVFGEIAGGILVESALHGSDTAKQDFTADLSVDPQVVTAWGQVYSNAAAARLALGSSNAIGDVVNNGLNSGLPAPALADKARRTYGLDQRGGTSLASYASNKVLPTNSTVLDVAAKLLVQRSRLMGDNEVFTALNFGRQLTYMVAQRKGILPPNAMKTWVTALDERVCPVCRPMDGVSVPLNEAFNVMMPIPKTKRGINRKSVQHIVPPVHPLCRCTVVPTERFEHGIITRTARFDDVFLTRHRGRLFSDAGDVILQKGRS